MTYDPLGRIKTGTDGDWHSRQFSYDTLDRVIQATDALGNTRSFQYDSNDNPTGQPGHQWPPDRQPLHQF